MIYCRENDTKNPPSTLDFYVYGKWETDRHCRGFTSLSGSIEVAVHLSQFLRECVFGNGLCALAYLEGGEGYTKPFSHVFNLHMLHKWISWLAQYVSGKEG